MTTQNPPVQGPGQTQQAQTQQASAPTPDQTTVVHGMSIEQHSPPPNGSGITIPSWFLQLLSLVVLMAGAIMVFAKLNADVEKLKETYVEIKNVQATQAQEFVSKQIFDMKMVENEKYQIQMNARFDKLEGLINGLYDRLPAKQHLDK